MKVFLTPKLKYKTWTKCIQPCSKTGEISGPNISLTVSLLLAALHFSLLICFTLTQSLVSLFPLALPHFLLDVSKEKNDFLFIQKTARKESENSALFTNNIRHPSHHAICGVSCLCSYFPSRYIRCYSVKGWG